jgi:hypothetical protein
MHHVNDDDFEPEEALAVVVKKRKFLLKTLLNDGHFNSERED